MAPKRSNPPRSAAGKASKKIKAGADVEEGKDEALAQAEKEDMGGEPSSHEAPTSKGGKKGGKAGTGAKPAAAAGRGKAKAKATVSEDEGEEPKAAAPKTHGKAKKGEAAAEVEAGDEEKPIAAATRTTGKATKGGKTSADAKPAAAGKGKAKGKAKGKQGATDEAGAAEGEAEEEGEKADEKAEKAADPDFDAGAEEVRAEEKEEQEAEKEVDEVPEEEAAAEAGAGMGEEAIPEEEETVPVAEEEAPAAAEEKSGEPGAEPSAKEEHEEAATEEEPTHWLVKDAPEDYTFDQLKQDGRTTWDGVRSAPARNNLRKMHLGDKGLFYQSSAGEDTGIVGAFRIAREPYPDPADENWTAVDIAYDSDIPGPVHLHDLKELAKRPEGKPIADMPLLKLAGRMSVQPVPEEAFRFITDGSAQRLIKELHEKEGTIQD